MTASLETPAPTASTPPSPGRIGLFLLILVGAIIAIYWAGLGGGYTFDDYPNIVDNTALHVSSTHLADWIAATFSSPASDLQRPLAMLSFAANYFMSGADPWPMKLTNIVIHSLNALLLFGVMRGLLGLAMQDSPASAQRRQWAALFVTAAWAFHPINLMAVLFVVQRMESLCHTFVFAGLWLYLAGRRRQIAGQGRGTLLVLGGLLGGTALGALAKESAVLLPVYAFCVELTVLAFRAGDRRVARQLVALFGLILVLPAIAGSFWLLPRVLPAAAWATRDFSLGERLLSEARVVIDYLHWTVLPALGQLSLYHDDYVPSRGWLTPPATLLSVIALAALLGAAAWLRTRRPLIALGILWFLAAQLLTATIIPLELVFEHRNYFASVGVMLILADVLILAPPAWLSRAGALFACLLVLFYAVTTHLRAREWSDPVRFAMSEAAKHPQSPRATYDFARTLIVLSEYHRDSPFVAQAFDALAKARIAQRGSILAEQATLILAARTETPIQRDWWESLWSKLGRHSLGPQDTSALGTLADCAAQTHCRFDPDDMLHTFAVALQQGPNPEVLSVYGSYALNVLGDPELCERLWRDAATNNPREAQYRANLVKLYVHLGRYDEARKEIDGIRALGRLGQNRWLAQELDERLRAAIEQQRKSSLDPAPAPVAQ